uniref:NB-ARC domain-containing protein n=1 Tax=Chenopodium quinoa TaxID=63459 RepID=A0A803MSR5_CHEQI
MQDEIAKELGVDLSEEGDDRKRAAILHKRLSTMGSTVLVLDDMWKWNPFSGMDIDFPIEGSSCKIILSSRSSKVCQEMGCKDFLIEVKVLPEGEAWNLFADKLGHYDRLTEEVKGIARSIAKEWWFATCNCYNGSQLSTEVTRLDMNLHLCTKLEKLCVWDCEELEEIFERDSTSQDETVSLVVDPMNAFNPQPNPILAHSKLQDISLGNLP